jgi:hypothetical protein
MNEQHATTDTDGSTPTSIRISAEGKRLMVKLQAKLGLRKSGVIELAIRRLAQAEGVE